MQSIDAIDKLPFDTISPIVITCLLGVAFLVHSWHLRRMYATNESIMITQGAAGVESPGGDSRSETTALKKEDSND